MKRRFRLNKRTDFERVRRTGTSYAHPLIVLVALPSESGRIRVGVSASRSVGGAVERNRAKRRIRAVVADRLPTIRTGNDIVFLARAPIRSGSPTELSDAVDQLLRRAKLTTEEINDL